MQHTFGVESGELYKHLGSGSVVIVRNVGKDGSITWESLTGGDLIEGHAWGKMKGTPFLQQFRSVHDSADMITDIRNDARLKHVNKPN